MLDAPGCPNMLRGARTWRSLIRLVLGDARAPERRWNKNMASCVNYCDRAAKRSLCEIAEFVSLSSHL